MKQLSIPNQSLTKIVKDDSHIKRIFQNLYYLAFGALLGTLFTDLKIALLSFGFIAIILIAIRVFYLKLLANRYTININDETLTMRGESFNKSEVVSLSYTQEPEYKDDYLKIKVKGFEERHICVYEEYYREELRLYHFVHDNFKAVKLIKNN